MRDRPSGHELLEVAAETLREQLLPVLPADRKYFALMVLNAMGIAGRQLAAGEGPLNDECDLLEVVLDVNPAAEALHARALELNRELARRVRAGAADHDEMLQHVLWSVTVQRVRESSPRYLQASRGGQDVAG